MNIATGRAPTWIAASVRDSGFSCGWAVSVDDVLDEPPSRGERLSSNFDTLHELTHSPDATALSGLANRSGLEKLSVPVRAQRANR